MLSILKNINERVTFTADKSRNKLIRQLLKTTDEEFKDEELIHMLLDEKMTANINMDEKRTFGQRAADAVATFAGSWAFIFSFLGIMAVWMVINLSLIHILNIFHRLFNR